MSNKKYKRLPTFEEFIEGGKGSGHIPEEFDKFELELGMRVELEHVSSDKEISQTDISDEDKNKKAEEIAIDHLVENPNYYTNGFKAGLFDEDISDILDKWKDDPRAGELMQAVKENEKFPHEIKSEKYWRQVLIGNAFALKVLDTIMNVQGGRASDRQMNILRRGERGDTTPYGNKN